MSRHRHRRANDQSPEETSLIGEVYGIHPVEELFADNPARISRLHLLKGANTGPINGLVALARQHKIPFVFEPRPRLDDLVDTDKHQGVVAQVSLMPYEGLDALLTRAADHTPGLVMVLDQVSDPRNLGAVLRTAEAAGCHGLIIPKRRAAAMTPLVAKVSAGACFHLPICRVDNSSAALDTLKREGFWIFGLDAAGDSPIDQTDFSAPTALVMGGEGDGIRPLVARHCDQLLNIPLVGRTNSLNISVAAGVAIFTVISSRGVGK